MTITRLPLPSNPLPGLAPCAGLWELFDSRRPANHRKARAICATCPLVAECKPPERFTIPPSPGVPGRPAGAIATANGTWGGRLYKDGQQIEAPPEPLPVACDQCGARQDQRCHTANGKTVKPHKRRRGPVMCPCGRAEPAPKHQYCEPCRRAARLDTYRLREDRTPTRDRRAKGAA